MACVILFLDMGAAGQRDPDLNLHGTCSRERIAFGPGEPLVRSAMGIE